MEGFYINIQTIQGDMVVTGHLQELNQRLNLRALPIIEPAIDVKNRGGLPHTYMTRDDALEVVGVIKFLKLNNILTNPINNITVERISY